MQTHNNIQTGQVHSGISGMFLLGKILKSWTEWLKSFVTKTALKANNLICFPANYFKIIVNYRYSLQTLYKNNSWQNKMCHRNYMQLIAVFFYQTLGIPSGSPIRKSMSWRVSVSERALPIHWMANSMDCSSYTPAWLFSKCLNACHYNQHG